MKRQWMRMGLLSLVAVLGITLVAALTGSNARAGINPKPAGLIIEQVPEFLYSNAKGLVPVRFKVVGLGDKVTFSELKVQFYVKGQKKYEENVVSGFPGIRAYNDNDKGFDIKGNGQDRQYIAWVNTAELGAAVGSVGTPNKILDKKQCWFVLLGQANGHPEPLDSSEYSVTEAAKVSVYGEPTVDVLNINYPAVMEGQAETLSITNQSAWASTTSENGFYFGNKYEPGIAFPKDPEPDQQSRYIPPPVGLFDPENYRFYFQGTTWGGFRRGAGNASVNIRLSLSSTGFYNPAYWAYWGRKGQSMSVLGSVGFYYGVSYEVKVIQGVDPILLGMNLDGKTDETGRRFQIFKTDSGALASADINMTSSESYTLDPHSFLSGLFALGATLASAAQPEATAAILLLSTLSSMADMTAGKFNMDGEQKVIIQGKWFRRYSYDKEITEPVQVWPNDNTGKGKVVTSSEKITFDLSTLDRSIKVGETSVECLTINCFNGLKCGFFEKNATLSVDWNLNGATNVIVR